jgi:flavin reductase (DIM6/NTAB) family NADH-FMN oxidoreductase RutF
MKRFSLADILDADSIFRRNFCNSFPGFKSLNLIGTVDERGNENLAIFNSVVHIGASPPLMGFILRPLTVPRVTYHNILATGYFTINHVPAGRIASAHQTSANYPTRTSEFEESGLTPHYENEFPAPYVAESRIRIGLKFEEKHEIAANGTILVVGAVQECYLPPEIVAKDGFLDLTAADSVSGSGLDAYYQPTPLGRYAYARPGKKPGLLSSE